MTRDNLVLETLDVETTSKPDASIIWLHGLGADGHDFESLVPELRLENLAIRFLFPHAPLQPVTINGGSVMRAWYDIINLEFGQAEDEPGIRLSAAAVESLIEQEISRGINAARIILAGFSQGGAIALHAALRYKKTLNSVLVLSTYLPLADTLPAECSEANQNTPIFMAHGTVDEVVATEYGRRSCELLTSQSYAVNWHEYPMAHSLCAEEILDIRQWIVERLG